MLMTAIRVAMHRSHIFSSNPHWTQWNPPNFAFRTSSRASWWTLTSQRNPHSAQIVYLQGIPQRGEIQRNGRRWREGEHYRAIGIFAAYFPGLVLARFFYFGDIGVVVLEFPGWSWCLVWAWCPACHPGRDPLDSCHLWLQWIWSAFDAMWAYWESRGAGSKCVSDYILWCDNHDWPHRGRALGGH